MRCPLRHAAGAKSSDFTTFNLKEPALMAMLGYITNMADR
jgi:hypothetical protein